MSDWFIRKSGFSSDKVLGPLTSEQVIALFNRGKIKKKTPIASQQHTGNRWVIFGKTVVWQQAQEAAQLEKQKKEMGTTTFAKDNLTAGETILHAGRFHPGLLNTVITINWIAFILVTTFITVGNGHISLVCFFPFFYLLYRWAHNAVYKTEFVLTTKRLVMKWGFLRTVSREIQLGKIESVDYGQTIIERWFNVGRLVIRGTGAGKIGTFRYLLDALEFRRRVLAQIDRVQA